jgi:hypothetical protein
MVKSATTRGIFERLRAMSDAAAVLFLAALDDATLHVIQKRWGQRECDCDLDILPCAEHGDVCDCMLTADRVLACARHVQPVSPLSGPVRAYLLWRLFPERYVDRPPPATPSRCMLPAAKAEVMAAREAAGLGLRHPQDWLRRYARGERDWTEVIDAERVVTTRQTNPDAPANGAPLPRPMERRTNGRALGT